MRFRCGGAVIDTGPAPSRRCLLAALCTVTLITCLYRLARSVTSTLVWHNEDTPLLGTPIDSVMRWRGLDGGRGLGGVQGRQGRSVDTAAPDYGPDEEEVLAPVAGARGPDAGERVKRKKTKQSNKVVTVMEASSVDRVGLARRHQKLIKSQNRAPDSRYNINVTFSDLLSPDRPIRDTRPRPCLDLRYAVHDLPSVTVIMPFYNEALSMLLRAVHSILSKSPDVLLDELLLVDDKSTDLHLQDSLDAHLQLLPKVRLIRNAKRVGLVVSRMNGFRLATSPVIIFLDAHIEVNVGWLEPLCEELKRNPRQILQPFIDGIDAMNLDYSSPGVYHKGAFSWDLRYTWLRQADHEHARAVDTGFPFPTPTLVGCAIAVDKTFFSEFGSFDESLQVWGGENTELSFRTWMCGSQLMTVTCSRIGHVFKNFPYPFDGDKEEIVQKNLMRVAETWMDSHKKFFYATTRVYPFKRAVLNSEELKTLQLRKDLRKRLNCHNFEWYLYNVIPEMEAPRMDARHYGEIMSLHTRACWEVTDDYLVGMTYDCYDHKIIPRNNFALTADGLLRYRDKCVRIVAPNPQLALAECPDDPTDKVKLESYGVWVLERTDVVTGFLRVSRRVDPSSDELEHWCVAQVTNVLPLHRGDQMPQLAGCDPNDRYQMWAFTYALDWSRVPRETLMHVAF